MAEIRITYRMRDLFFDRPAVQAAIDRGERVAMSRIGAFIRQRARSSMRRRKAISAPGSPPSVHSQDRESLKTILFAHDPGEHRVVVGPVRFHMRTNTQYGRATVPEIQEFGGHARIQEVMVGRYWFRLDGRRSVRIGQPKRSRPVYYPARPFMGPALDAEVKAGTITQAWRAAVSR